MKVFERPIPGQSLTAEPNSQAFERPPEIVEPIEALDVHMNNLMRPGAMEDVLYFLEFGIDLVTLVQGILRSAVMEGIHTIDTSLIIAPVLHEYIKGFAEATDIEYEEGFGNKEEKKVLNYKRDVARAKKLLSQLEEEKEIEIPMTIEELKLEEISEKKEIEEEKQIEKETEETPVKTGLMARV
tara:strand:- start:1176 stop:1727 length:552 start_codon:yes stop_codon:yes gene_type:complete